jgi:hypothetical protein
MDTYAGSVRVSGGSNMERVQRVEDIMKSSISKNEPHKMMHIPSFSPPMLSPLVCTVKPFGVALKS